MLTVDRSLCIGCGQCADLCTVGAISMVENVARIDQSLCTMCGLCAELCPEGAIRTVADVIPGRQLVVPPRGEVISPTQAPVPWYQHVLPAVGTALTFAGREVIPRLAPAALHALDQWLDRRSSVALGWQVPPRTGSAIGARGGPRRRLRRRGR